MSGRVSIEEKEMRVFAIALALALTLTLFSVGVRVSLEEKEMRVLASALAKESVRVSVSFEEKETSVLALALTLALFLYPERDLNPHNRYGHRILSPACLPFHHPGNYCLAVLRSCGLAVMQFNPTYWKNRWANLRQIIIN